MRRIKFPRKKYFLRQKLISVLIDRRKNFTSLFLQKRQNFLALIKPTKRRVSRTERFNPVTLFCRLNRVIQGWKVKRGRKVNRWVDLSIILKRAADGRSKKRNLFILNPDWTGKDERYNWPSRIIPFVEPERVVEYPSILCCELFRGLWFRRVMTSISSIATKESKAR